MILYFIYTKVLYVWMVHQSDISQHQVCSCASTLSFQAHLWAPRSRHARRSWLFQLGIAAQKSPALQHVCHTLLTGHGRRRAREHRGTPLGCFNWTLMNRLPVSSKCWGSSSLVSLTPGYSSWLPTGWIWTGSSVLTARRRSRLSTVMVILPERRRFDLRSRCCKSFIWASSFSQFGSSSLLDAVRF